MNYFKLILLMSAVIFTAGCNNAKSPTTVINSDSSKVTATLLPSAKAYQQTIDGKQTDLFVLKNKNNMQAAITNSTVTIHYAQRTVNITLIHL